MNKKILQENYDFQDYFNSNNKKRIKVVYKGKYYRINNESLMRDVFIYILSVLILISFVVPLFFNSIAFKTIYFVFPFILEIFEVFYIELSTYKYMTIKKPYKIDEYISIFKNGKTASFLGIIFSFLAIIGSIFMIFNNELDLFSYITIILNLFLFIYYIVYFKLISEYKFDLEENKICTKNENLN